MNSLNIKTEPAKNLLRAEKYVHPQQVMIAQAAELEDDIVTGLSSIFKVLGDPTRIRILNALSHAELCVCDLAELLSMMESAVSHQLRILRTNKLVRSRRRGKNVFYTLDDDHVRTLFAQGLEHVSEDRKS